jgi:hypothetical protein
MLSQSEQDKIASLMDIPWTNDSWFSIKYNDTIFLQARIRAKSKLCMAVLSISSSSSRTVRHIDPSDADCNASNNVSWSCCSLSSSYFNESNLFFKLINSPPFSPLPYINSFLYNYNIVEMQKM